VDQVAQVKIRDRGEDQDQEEESGGFPVKKETGGKQKCVPGGALAVDQRIDQQHHEVETPEKKPGEDQRLLGIKKEYVPPRSAHLECFWVSKSLYSSIRAL
jgi:hypothetical protein